MTTVSTTGQTGGGKIKIGETVTENVETKQSSFKNKLIPTRNGIQTKIEMMSLILTTVKPPV